ncbi:TIGR01457 family HAD-type hydrolase [Effusibacillus dendaii]|uniref:Acid sugar phosphatase n=1 Tax=Effusibacillus dendaii TaxID=2743772 RepID=A0A7I8DDR8_9BACL|nr:TIGR01457 family HAD-type hydrolase [Effusibacillus dendaii]BCJ88264.1 haloacid dehalogenase [Effusibacillus dendaii]
MTESIQSLLACDGFLIDLDGTIYRGNELLPGAKEFIAWLERIGKPYLFVTNNSSRTNEQFAQKLQQMGISAGPEHLFTSSQATAMYIREQAAADQPSVYIIGEEGLYTALREVGCRIVNRMDDAETVADTGLADREDEALRLARPDFVVVGIDRQFTYQKLMTASLAIQNGAIFLATNADKRLPTERGLLPGAGSLCQALSAASGQEPVWIGKPEVRMMRYSLQRIGTQPERTVMIGDNLETDIRAGRQAGLKTLLVLSGYSSREDAEQAEYPPDFVMNDLTDFLRIIAEE